MIHILHWANPLHGGAWGGTSLVGFAQETLEPVVLYLPEPPKHFIEIVAVATILFIAAWRRA